MTEEPASLILELLRQMRAELATKTDLQGVRSELKSEIAGLRSEVADVKSDMHSLRADVAADILSTRNDLSEQIDGLRQTVINYHAMALRFCPSLRRLSATAAAPTHA